jgi:hypothetical protein
LAHRFGFAFVVCRALPEPTRSPARCLVEGAGGREVRMRRWMVVVLGLAVAFLQGCSSGMGSSLTGPSSPTTGRTGASDTAGGRSGSESGANQMM